MASKEEVDELTKRLDEISDRTAEARASQSQYRAELDQLDQEVKDLSAKIDNPKENVPTTEFPSFDKKAAQADLKSLKTKRNKVNTQFEDLTKAVSSLENERTDTLRAILDKKMREARQQEQQETTKSKSEVERLTQEMEDLRLSAEEAERELKVAKARQERENRVREDREREEREEREDRDRDRERRDRRREETPAEPPRTRSLATLPTLMKAGDYTEHLKRVGTYLRLNSVTRTADKKDLLLMSFSHELAQRLQGIDPSQEPYRGMTNREFQEAIRQRMIPKASSSILRSQFESLTQKPEQYVVDYFLEKHGLFSKAYPCDAGVCHMPVSFLTRNLVEGIFNDELRAEMYRKVGDDEEQNESDDQEEMTEAFNSILQKVNSALDFCRRSQGVKADNDKKGLSIVSPIKPGTTPTSVTTAFGQFQKINNIENEGEGGAGPGGEVYEEAWEEAPGDEVYTVEEGGELNDPDCLSEDQINFCTLLEEQQQTDFWEADQGEGGEVHEVQGEEGKGGARRGLCWVCGSDKHYKRQCGMRLKAINSRINQLMGAPTRRGGRGSGGRIWRGTWSRTGTRTRRPQSAPRSSAPFGFGRGGQAQFYPQGSAPTYYPSTPRFGRGNFY